jgi:uncharacterized protein YbaR (Trm112 family)
MTDLPLELRSVLVCPRCRGELEDAADGLRVLLVCGACHLAYPLEQGIPVLLRDRAMAWPPA